MTRTLGVSSFQHIAEIKLRWNSVIQNRRSSFLPLKTVNLSLIGQGSLCFYTFAKLQENNKDAAHIFKLICKKVFYITLMATKEKR